MSKARALVVELHDVAPETWPDYQPFVEAVDALGEVPLTWLVVPDFHGRNPLEVAPGFRRLLNARRARGDELVLHGCFHRDDGPVPRTPRSWFLRRIFTHEGEFKAIDASEAQARIARGIALFRRNGWPLQGFVAPGWLTNRATRRVLADSELLYTSDPGRLYLLPSFAPIKAPTLVWSAGSAWRRGLSRMVSEACVWRHEQAPLLRLALHPEDMRHDFARRYWLALLERLIAAGRQPVTQADWLARHAGLAGEPA